MKKHIPHFLTCEISHNFFKDPTMTRRKLKIMELQNMKIKSFQCSQEERQIPPLSPCENFTQFFLKTHKMTRRKFENFGTSK
jgi:hypothetical protein